MFYQLDSDWSDPLQLFCDERLIIIKSIVINSKNRDTLFFLFCISGKCSTNSKFLGGRKEEKKEGGRKKERKKKKEGFRTLL